MPEAWETEERDDKGRWEGGGSGGGGPEVTGKEAGSVWAATRQSVDPAEYQAVRGYQGALYGWNSGEGKDPAVVVNSQLRGEPYFGDKMPDASLTIQGMDSAIAKQAPSSQDTVLYHGINSNVETDYSSMKPGETFTKPDYTSTSVMKAVGTRFSNSLEQGNGQLLEIHAPEGSQGLHMASVTGEEAGLGSPEREVLLPRGSTFEVLKQTSTKTIVALKQ